MAAPGRQYLATVLLLSICLTMVFGCAGRRITTAVQDQTVAQRPAAAPVEAATVTPPPVAPAEPPPVVLRDEPKMETPPPAAAPESTDARTPELPITPTPAPAPPASAAPTRPAAPPPLVTPAQPAPAVPPVRPSPPPGVISDVFFDFDQYAIRRDAFPLLEANAAAIKAQAGDPILIEGHCDERGTSAYNLVLGERRAQTAARYLRELGVPASQLQIRSYGKERPFCTEHTEDCWQSNRRAHFTR